MKQDKTDAAGRKTKRKWLSWKTQHGVVAWVGRFLWFRAKRAVA